MNTKSSLVSAAVGIPHRALSIRLLPSNGLPPDFAAAEAAAEDAAVEGTTDAVAQEELVAAVREMDLADTSNTSAGVIMPIMSTQLPSNISKLQFGFGDTSGTSACGSVDDVAAAAPGGALQEPPTDFICPITTEVMDDPVMAADGHAYERSAIERWLASKSTSPLTGSELDHPYLTPNHILRRQIRDWQKA